MRLGTALVLLTLLFGPRPLFAGEGEIPGADNFSETSLMLSQQGVPAVVFISRDACPYCRTLRDKVLKPMFAADKFENRAILLELSLDRSVPLTGFDNTRMTAKEFGESYGAEITPTLLFLDPQGREIGKRIIGISNLDMYSHYLQKSIDQALQAMHSDVKQN